MTRPTGDIYINSIAHRQLAQWEGSVIRRGRKISKKKEEKAKNLGKLLATSGKSGRVDQAQPTLITLGNNFNGPLRMV